MLSKDNLLSLRCDNKFMTIFHETVSLCTELDIDAPQMPRQRRPPKRFTGTAHVPNSSADYFRIQYFNFVDRPTAMNAIEKRYNQDGLKKYVKLENILTQAAGVEMVDKVLAGYPDIDPERLIVQLAMAKQQHWGMSSVGEVAEKLRSLDPAVRSMFNEPEQLVRLLLTVP